MYGEAQGAYSELRRVQQHAPKGNWKIAFPAALESLSIVQAPCLFHNRAEATLPATCPEIADTGKLPIFFFLGSQLWFTANWLPAASLCNRCVGAV